MEGLETVGHPISACHQGGQGGSGSGAGDVVRSRRAKETHGGQVGCRWATQRGQGRTTQCKPVCALRD